MRKIIIKYRHVDNDFPLDEYNTNIFMPTKAGGRDDNK